MSIHGRGHSAKARISDYTFSLNSLDSLLVSGARASKVTGGQLKLRDSDVTLNGPWTLGMIHNAYPACQKWRELSPVAFNSHRIGAQWEGIL